MRRLLFVVLAILVGASLIGGGAWLWWRSGDPRERLAALLSESLGRQVVIGAVDVNGDGTVVLRDVEVGNPLAWDGAPMFTAASIDIDVALEELLDRELVGQVEATAIDLRVIKQAGSLNLAGLVPRRAAGGDPIDLHLAVVIHAARVTLDDLDRDHHAVLDGVDLRVLLSNRDGSREAQANVEIARIDLHALAIEQVAFVASASNDKVALSELSARLGKSGRLQGAGEVFLRGEQGWSFDLEATDVDLDDEVRPVVAAFYPPIASGADAIGASAQVGARVSLGGTGLHWEQVKPSLAGRGRLALANLQLPATSLLLAIAELAGRPSGPFSLESVAVEFSLANGWIALDRISADEHTVALPVTGRVSLAGELDLKVELMPAVRAFGGGAYAKLAQITTSIPVRVGGTLAAPKLRPPSAGDIGSGLLGGALTRALTAADSPADGG